jgi:hypothetical protein
MTVTYNHHPIIIVLKTPVRNNLINLKTSSNQTSSVKNDN